MVSVYKNCGPEMRNICAKVSKPDMFKCLHQAVLYAKTKPMSMGCRASVKRAAVSMSKNAYELPSFVKACKAESKKFCPAEMTVAVRGRQYGELIKCLVEHKDEIKEPNCKSAVHQVVKEEAEDIQLNAFEQSVCAADEQKFCKTVTPGSGRMHECLRKHEAELSAECREEEFKEEVREQEDVAIIPAIRDGCVMEMKAFCADVGNDSSDSSDADLHQCLLDHLDDSEFGSECRTALEDNEVTRSTDIQLQPRMFKRCLTDEVELCSFKKASNSKKHSGRVQNCMVENFHEIKDPLCAKDVFKMGVSQIVVPISMPSFRESCVQDIKSLCKGARRLALSTCVMSHEDDLSDKCKALVPHMKRRMSMKMDYDVKKARSKQTNQNDEQYHGIVLTGNLALLSISSLILVSSALTYWLWKKIANPGKGYTVVHVSSNKGY